MAKQTSTSKASAPERTSNSGNFCLALALTNQKGGVGKTTTAVNLGACLAERGIRTLVVDADPQGNATTGLGIDRTAVRIGTYEVLMGAPVTDGIVAAEGFTNLWVLPSTIDLAGAEVELTAALARENRLRKALVGARGWYDVILIDSPPSLGLLTINSLVAADAALVPVQCEYYALEGLGSLTQTIELVRESLNPTLAIGGVVLTMFDKRTRLAEQVVAEVKNHFGNRVFDTLIPRSVRLSEAPGFGKPIVRYDGSAKGAKAYRALADEAIQRFDLAPRHDAPEVPVVIDLASDEGTDDEREAAEEPVTVNAGEGTT